MEAIKNTITDAQRRKLFYLFKGVGLDDDVRHDMIEGWTNGRTNSLSGLTFMEGQQMIRQMEEMLRQPQERKVNSALDTKRKGVLRAIFAYLENKGIDAEIDYVKGIAVRASGMVQSGDIAHDFNRISEATLTRIYNEFCQKQKVQNVKRDVSFKISIN